MSERTSAYRELDYYFVMSLCSAQWSVFDTLMSMVAGTCSSFTTSSTAQMHCGFKAVCERGFAYASVSYVTCSCITA